MNTRILLFALLLIGTLTAHADPRVTSWFTDRSGVYARIYETTADESAQNAVTTWSRGQGTQNPPTYAGVHEVSHTPDWVYIRTTGLGSHIMGPWYLNAAKTNLFPNYPANRAVLYRIPRFPTFPGTKINTGLGAIGYFVDGVALFDNRDAFSYDNSAGQDDSPNAGAGVNGDGIWNRDAYINESVTFDAANAHQAGSNYHYHANPPALRSQLGDSVDYNESANVYTENFNGNHSPILAWARDGIPIYGPYGYSDPNNPASPVTRMLSGYQKRDGTNGTTNLPVTGRTSLPAWAVVAQGIGPALAPGQFGPAVTAGAGSQYELGHYIEDYDFVGGGHLDVYNGRTCVTPEFPGGTYAYFVAIEADGTPAYPYNIGRQFNGDPTGGAVGTIPAAGDAGALTKHFEGGPEKDDSMESLSVDDPSPGDMTIIWSGVEGATYQINGSTDLGSTDPWTPVNAASVAPFDMLSDVHSGVVSSNDFYYYRVDRTDLAAFDDDGFDYPGAGPGPSVTFTANFPTTPPLPPQGAVTSITVGGIVATIVSYDQGTGVVELNFDPGTLAPGSYNAILNFSPGGTPTQVFSTNQYTVLAPATDNILFLIVDDWGIDRSPIDNTLPVPLPNMPNLQTLASGGLRFTRAYVNPACSPTRASLMTGRYAHQTKVYTPQNAGNFATTELTLPEALTAAGSNFAMGSQGKWHLGGGVTGFSVRGGWDDFRGITGGAVNPSYTDWTKNNNGTDILNYGVYSTTDQVNEAITFINASETAGDPWLCWVAFNAPHDPFHDPPAGLAPPGGYSAQEAGENANRWNYRKMLEALDTEMGRLLAAIDQNTTNIILIGDNGTPNQTVQAPFGPEGAGAAAHGKGDLYNGGIHVPMVFKGPAYTGTAGATTDKLVHAVDLYATILELAGVDPSSVPGMPATALAQSTSIVPILKGTDAADRCMIAEGGTGANAGRAIIMDDYPTYKMIVFGDPESTADTPTIEFYGNITTSDQNEQSPLYNGPVTATPPLSGTDLDAYTACYNKDQAMGGGYSDPPVAAGDTLYLELPNTTGPTSPPGNMAVDPTLITIDDGTATNRTATYIARVDSGPTYPPVNADESDDAAARYWVKCTLPAGITGPYSNAVVTFPDNPNNGAPRVFSAITIEVKP